MGLYRNVILPSLCDFVMRNRFLLPYRERIIGSAEGTVLEIGAGSGLNLPLYGAGVKEILALEPDPKLMTMARHNAKQARRPVTFLDASAEAIPLEDRSVDTVVTTWTLCTIPEAMRALEEMRRVLKPAGHLLFAEHGLAPEESVCKWQNRLTPAWKCISGGCHLNRPIRQMIESGGFSIDQIDTGYAPGPKPMSFLYEGSARPTR
ncbi:class I SAM-dependent methyltransferase [Paraburkholderia fungorum]|jgi:ubiquinone/menaquinone biosynthesis C-methylase UbiE|uniref:UbiE/COQ5 methyltransferase family protein n=1 Tax=Paraburkholderia fungorum TaxID=134537 RepID=A0AAW3V311_9BURK|nr:class I SAM-dependent methyltransferase [Paraburkholderia fungorum]AJZ56330.1 ubiE/COQ5 methyltransferase family protein [Paraburkholderia fungorum]MBB4516574.1 ubiquinone/menaquinone biosynthesis C-methylase UbiE [Paraburkholderia fungorum]MBB5545169.1 ubiquinone/menaquinone biosynthesis C-methylase UbiE [Paraburkholderia fungorum]MBB6204953.1 ubiquinone/menaquinone biosynthesis C-methylase UbiE [Paraburkholderia fungorum]MBU7440575.1 class I SAM-dependent methyltransferase [Paraburkholder